MRVLALNCGSSSLKYALFDDETVVVRDSIERVDDHAAAVHSLLDKLGSRPDAVGHRLVHGGSDHVEPVLVDDEVLASLTRLVPFAPLHLPAELAAIAAVRARFDSIPQVACFDTAFHRTLPEVARRFALPSSLFEAGVRRYGFHGLSYEYIASRLPPERLRRAVFAHLGSGASMVAICDGRSIDTTMGFSPAGGLVMGTRCGDLDPGLILYLLDHGYDRSSLDRLVNHEAGLLGLSGSTSDMRRLLDARATDPSAALAVDSFCYHARKSIGAFAAVLGGIDTLVFAGGIGEHAPAIRAAICSDLEHLGVVLDTALNEAGDALVSRGKCEVYVIATDEERMIARATRNVTVHGP